VEDEWVDRRKRRVDDETQAKRVRCASGGYDAV
jgi:hypothetical protein